MHPGERRLVSLASRVTLLSVGPKQSLQDPCATALYTFLLQQLGRQPPSIGLSTDHNLVGRMRLLLA